MEDVIVRLIQRTVPTGYATHSWIRGTGTHIVRVCYICYVTPYNACVYFNAIIISLLAGREERNVERLRG